MSIMIKNADNCVHLINKLRLLSAPTLKLSDKYLLYSSESSPQLPSSAPDLAVDEEKIVIIKRDGKKYEIKDVPTHTHQRFSEDDYRLVRFLDKTKEVNPRWAINLIAEIPPTPVNDRYAVCNGGGGPLGHPKVFINLDDPGNHSCGYCGLRFYKKDDHHH